MSKRLTADDLERIRSNSFSTAYHELVDDSDDWPGMIAYCHYKEDVTQRCARFDGDIEDLRRDLTSRKNLTSHDIEMLRRNARMRVEAYAQAAIDGAKPAIERDALSKDIGRLNQKLSRDVDHLFAKVRDLPEELNKGRLRQFALGVGASFVAYVIILGVPDLFDWFAERDPGAQMQQLRSELQQLAFNLEEKLGPLPADIEPAAGPDLEQQSTQAIVESRLPAIPEAYRDEAIVEDPRTTETRRLAVWARAASLGSENEKNGFRQDICGAWIRYADLDDRDSPYGWTIGGLLPADPNGGQRTEDLQPLHLGNAVRADGSWRCAVISEGGANLPATSQP